MRGIIPALLTAYDDEGAYDHGRNCRVVGQLIDDGVDGFFVGGSTGESLLQTVSERKAVLESVIGYVDGRLPIIAHIGAVDTPTSVELAQFATALGATALAAVTPIYFALTPDEHAAYYRRLAEVSDLPLIAYHIPGRSGVSLSAGWFIDLAADGVLQGLKYTSTDLFPLAEIRRQTPEGFVIYNGSDEVLLAGLALGADGGIGSTYNAIPHVYLKLRAAVLAGDLAEARRLQAQANHFIAQMSAYNFIAFLRHMLELRGLAMGNSRGPLPALTEQQRAALTALVRTDPIFAEIVKEGSTSTP